MNQVTTFLIWFWDWW